MRFDNIKQASRDNAKRVYASLKLINRHALILVPLLGLTFAIIAGRIAEEYGAHYLFRDNEVLNYLGLCPHTGLCIAQSARFHTALYATALMGMLWTLFVLIESRDDNPEELHPVGKINAVLPGVFLLGFIMVLANLMNWGDGTERFFWVLALAMLGYLAGLSVVAIVTKLGLLLSQRIKVHQLWTFSLLSILLGGVVAALPLITPSKAILIVLAGIVLVYCAFEVAKAHYRFPLALAILVLFMVGSIGPRYKYRFEGLEAYYNPAPSEAAVPAPLIEPEEALEAWLKHQPADSRKLVIVAASGGAYRAAFWTAIVLDKLSELKGFDRAVRLMTGASGGMVGTAYFAASRQPPPGLVSRAGQPCRGETPTKNLARHSILDLLSEDLRAQRKSFWLANSQTDSLTPVVQRFIGVDMPLAFVPITNWWDRGRVLEAGWRTLQPTFCNLAAGEREGWRPSLIVSPYLVDAAKPMFISNLNLSDAVKGKSGESGLAMEFFQAFPKAYPAFTLATAVRMSATFPFISPAVRLPQDRSRVVDAGYFDNFGITAAAMFLRSEDVRRFVKKHEVQVILIRIVAWKQEEQRDGGGLWQRLSQVTEVVLSPLEGALAARETRGKFANALLLESLKHTYNDRFHPFEFVNPIPASYSWHIQTHDLNKMREAMADDHNKKELARLMKVWGD